MKVKKNSKFSAATYNFIRYVKNHQLLVSPKKRIYGVAYTLIGWFFIALNLSVPKSQKSIQFDPLSLLIQFTAGALFLWGASKLMRSSLKVDDSTDQNYKAHFNVATRKFLIIFRALLASAAYMALVYAKSFLGVVNDSAIFGADALIYALLMSWILKEDRTFLDWLGIIIASLGVLLPFVINSQTNGPFLSIVGGLIGLASSIFLSIILFINSVLVRHEPALRIAFYEVLLGAILSFVFTLILFPKVLYQIAGFSSLNLLTPILSGLVFAVALLFFFKAFLYTEVILIAITGYTLDPMCAALAALIHHEYVTLYEWITIGLITIGTALLYHEEHKKGQKRQKLRVSQPIYEPTLAEEFEENDQLFQRGEITADAYRANRKSFNDLLFKISDEIIDTDLDKIELEKGSVYFTFFDPNIRFECSDDIQSVPIEILNFGSYWKQELEFMFQILGPKSTLIDFSAQVGWLSLNIAKKLPQSTVYAFEPNLENYSHLIRNISANQCPHVIPVNQRLSNRNKHETFYLLPEELILTPKRNALIYSQLAQVDCTLTSLDAFMREQDVTSLDMLAGHCVGNEIEIVKGARKTLQEKTPVLFFELIEEYCQEYHSSIEDLIHFLASLNYHPYALKNSKPQLLINNPCLFFFHTDKHAEMLKKFQNQIEKQL